VANPIRKSKFEDAEQLNYDGCSCQPLKVKGDWLCVSCGMAEDKTKGWKKWKTNGVLTVELYYRA
jgi:hypothetical protein